MNDYILLPGLDGTGLLSTKFARLLGESGHCHVVLYPSSAVTLEACSKLLESALKKAPHAVVIAESFSGAVFLHAMAHNGLNPNAAVFIATFGKPPRLLLGSVAPFIPNWLMKLGVRFGLRSFCLNGETPRNIVDEALNVIQSLSLGVVKARLDALRNWKPPRDFQMPREVLILEARHDLLVDAESTEALRKLFPAAVVEKVAGPHFLTLTKPAECLEQILKFLKPV
ncbi:MAG: alpha/beta fold hydrolase [Burkholderiales bacterium]|jgi:pimeloyl-ACP methyl ester carboxylesterase|nr:alpha/beta hydrolase [Betaproteobacteria bacterium]